MNTDKTCPAPQCGGAPIKLHCESLTCTWRVCSTGHVYRLGSTQWMAARR